MKKFLMAAIAVFMMAGTSVASESVAVVENNVTTTVSENAVDKVIAMVKGYIQKINAAKTMEELMGLAEAFGEEMMSLEEKYGDEIAALEETLSPEQMEKYEAEMEKVMAEMEAAVTKKVEQLGGEL